MGENSAIEWTHHTFNPWIGCQKVGPGCDHCYAEALSTARLGVPWGAGVPRRRTAASTWAQPRRWNRRAAAAGLRERVFCASLADVLDPDAPSGAREDLGRLVLDTPSLDWLFLTKRIGNAARMLPAMFPGSMPANVWLGATIVNQAEADRDIPKLLGTPVSKRFLSMEPLLGPVDLKGWIYPGWDGDIRHARPAASVSWVIVGGESGPGARPMHPDWVISLRDQCNVAGKPFLFKQWGEWRPLLSADILPRDGARAGTVRAADGMLRTGGVRHEFGPAYAADVLLVGKKAAGRLLDGRTHDAVPA